MATADLTAAHLREVLHYDPETGIFSWRVPAGRWGRTPAGTVAGSIDVRSKGVRIRIGGSLHRAHRLAFLYMTGDWPKLQCVDHIDGNPFNNRFSNLRDTTHSVNAENRKLNGPMMGVDYIPANQNPYLARLRVDRKLMTLGHFATPDEAQAAYLEAKRLLHAGNRL